MREILSFFSLCYKVFGTHCALVFVRFSFISPSNFPLSIVRDSHTLETLLPSGNFHQHNRSNLARDFKLENFARFVFRLLHTSIKNSTFYKQVPASYSCLLGSTGFKSKREEILSKKNSFETRVFETFFRFSCDTRRRSLLMKTHAHIFCNHIIYQLFHYQI